VSLGFRDAEYGSSHGYRNSLLEFGHGPRSASCSNHSGLQVLVYPAELALAGDGGSSRALDYRGSGDTPVENAVANPWHAATSRGR
jgi:hypothetical protein